MEDRHPILTRSERAAASMVARVWRRLVGNPLATHRLSHERLTKIKGLAIFSSDALSSCAYATEEILRVLVLAGVAGLGFTLPLSLAIGTLLVIVAISYNQTIHAYPTGGGAYIVVHQNLGDFPGLIAGSALLVDYILTVAVSVSAGVAALTSAAPQLLPFRLEIAIAFVALITITNLRGIRESGTIFAIPTYLFVFGFGGMILWGFIQMVLGNLPHVAPVVELEQNKMHALSLFLILRAFASGAAALTGIEAVSDGVPAFYPPEPRNASRVLITMVVLLGCLFLGVRTLAHWIGIVPQEHETVVSQIARTLFGASPFYYVIQVSTTLILILAANTAYADFPRLSSILARDRYLPRQLSNLGDRLVFSNGIILLGVMVSILLILFHAETHGLIPLYMVGVFISFTLSQAGMVRRAQKLEGKKPYLQMSISAFGALCTGVVGIVVAIVKFSEGAWITLLVICILIAIMRAIRKHYDDFVSQIILDNTALPKPFTSHKVLVPISGIHRGVLDTMRYARAVSGDVTGVYIEIDPAHTPKLKAEWAKWFPDVELTILQSPYRSLTVPLLRHLDHLQREGGTDRVITVVMPDIIPRRRWHHILHNQSALMLRLALLYRRRRLRYIRVVAEVPFYLKR